MTKEIELKVPNNSIMTHSELRSGEDMGMKEEILLFHIPRLAAQSAAVNNLSHKEQLQIIDEIKQQLRSKSWMYADVDKKIRYGDYESALLQLGPKPSFDTKGNYRKIKYSRDADVYRAFSEFNLAYCLLGILDAYSQRLKYDLQKLNKKSTSWITPTLFSRVSPLSQNWGYNNDPNSILVHGRVPIPFLFNSFEVWTKINSYRAPSNNMDNCEVS